MDGIILKGTPSQIPPGAILLSKGEAAKMQWNVVRNWTPQSETWALRFGHIMLSGATAVTSLLITGYYRNRLKLGSFGRITTQIPTVFLPSMLAAYLHTTFVATPILLQNECPICIQLRSSFLQTACSIVMPGILAPLASFGYAYNYGSYQLPDLTVRNAREYFKIYWKFTRKYQRTLGFMLASNALFATFLTYKEGTLFYQIQFKRLTERAEIENKVYGNTSKPVTAKISDEQIVNSSNKSV